jgi:3-methyl-2-oxobutanoate hydroxymethyltransferase
MTRQKISVVELGVRKQTGPKICAVTVYDATFARLFEAAEVDLMLVGDSLGMAVQGLRTTLPVTVEEICYHARAVARTEPRAHLCGDLPFLSYQSSVERAVDSAGRLLKEGGCESVKLEGGAVFAEHVRAIVNAGIPVMGHLGLTPQSVHAFGGFRVQGRDPAAQVKLLDDAQALVDAGVYAITLEGIPCEVAQRITQSVSVPTIGIGAGPHCDGQVLVCYDLLGLEMQMQPKFVRRFAELGQATIAATLSYVQDVRAGAFPAQEHCYGALPSARRAQPTLRDGGELGSLGEQPDAAEKDSTRA